MSIITFLYYQLPVLAPKGHHQANVYKNLKMNLHTVQNRSFCGIPLAFIGSLYNYYQLYVVLSVVIYVEIL
jgi:hypothetical protein